MTALLVWLLVRDEFHSAWFWNTCSRNNLSENNKGAVRLWGKPEPYYQHWYLYLLIVLQFIVQDDSIGLIGLGPGQCDAVRGSADLVDDGHCWRYWEENQRRVRVNSERQTGHQDSTWTCHPTETQSEPHQPGWWWCWQMCTVASKDSGRTRHWQLGFQKCTGCEPRGRWCGRECRSVPADVGQTARCLHSGCSHRGHCHSSYIWCCRQRPLDHQTPVVRPTPAWERSHSLWRWRLVELMEQLGNKWEKWIGDELYSNTSICFFLDLL